jgi:hypothetical protein
MKNRSGTYRKTRKTLPIEWGRIKVGVIQFAKVKRFGKNSQEKTDRGRKSLYGGT